MTSTRYLQERRKAYDSGFHARIVEVLAHVSRDLVEIQDMAHLGVSRIAEMPIVVTIGQANSGLVRSHQFKGIHANRRHRVKKPASFEVVEPLEHPTQSDGDDRSVYSHYSLKKLSALVNPFAFDNRVPSGWDYSRCHTRGNALMLASTSSRNIHFIGRGKNGKSAVLVRLLELKRDHIPALEV